MSSHHYVFAPHDWSLNPGLYTAVAAGDDDDFDEQLFDLFEYDDLSDQANALRAEITAAVTGILDS